MLWCNVIKTDVLYRKVKSYHIEIMTGDVECSNETKCEINNFLNNTLTTMAFIKIWLMIIIFLRSFWKLSSLVYILQTIYTICEMWNNLWFLKKNMFRSLVIPLNRKNHLFLETNGISLNVPKSGKHVNTYTYIYML